MNAYRFRVVSLLLWLIGCGWYAWYAGGVGR